MNIIAKWIYKNENVAKANMTDSHFNASPLSLSLVIIYLIYLCSQEYLLLCVYNSKSLCAMIYVWYYDIIIYTCYHFRVSMCQ